MEDPRKTYLVERIKERTEKAQEMLRKTFQGIVAKRLASSKSNGNGDADYGWTLPKKEENPSIIRIASIVLKEVGIEDYEDILGNCSDCGIVYIKGCDEVIRNRFNNMDPASKEILVAVIHSLNGIMKPPVMADTLFERGMKQLTSGVCVLCNRNNGYARAIRKKQKPFDCFGSCLDHCTEEAWCRHPMWSSVICVVPREAFGYSESDLWHSCTKIANTSSYLVCYPTWLLRVLYLKEKGLYRFSIRREDYFDFVRLTKN